MLGHLIIDRRKWIQYNWIKNDSESIPNRQTFGQQTTTMMTTKMKMKNSNNNDQSHTWFECIQSHCILLILPSERVSGAPLTARVARLNSFGQHMVDGCEHISTSKLFSYKTLSFHSVEHSAVGTRSSISVLFPQCICCHNIYFRIVLLQFFVYKLSFDLIYS